jgi:putative ABC transport system permease protein
MMSLLNSFRIAVEALRLNALRSFLAMLGVIIGVASVIVMISVAAGASQAIEERIRALGTNLLTIQPGAFTSGGRRHGVGSARQFTDEDVEVIREQVPGVATAAGTVGDTARLIAGNINWTTSVTGITLDYLEVRNWRLVEGRGFVEADMRSAAQVTILGDTVARELFGHPAYAIGQPMRIDNVPVQVIGVLEAKGGGGEDAEDDDVALLPATTARRRLFGARRGVQDHLRTLLVQVADGAEMKVVREEIEDVLRQRRGIRPGDSDDFRVRDMADLIRTRSETQTTLSLLLGATAIVSLIVGGIGIMNIMLVSVTERTREIGLRMAVGARQADILTQFLTEAVTLCLMGGCIGLTIGGVGAIALAQWGAWPVAITPTLVLIALISAGGVGVFFGYYPARQAAAKSPIEALRYE